MKAALEVRGATIVFAGLRAVSDVTFDVPKGTEGLKVRFAPSADRGGVDPFPCRNVNAQDSPAPLSIRTPPSRNRAVNCWPGLAAKNRTP